MINLSPEFCHKIKEARRAARLGQTVVAQQVGCKQGALSMFENGGITKVNDDVIRKLSELFNVEIITVGGEEKKSAATPLDKLKAQASLVQPGKAGQGFCPNAHCPSNHGYEIDGRYLLRPDRAACDPVGARFCAFCGEVLERVCPNCGSPIHDGAICSFCGEPYVAV